MIYREDFYTRSEAAEALGISPGTVKRLVAEGTIKPGTVVGNRYYFRISDVEALKQNMFTEGLSYKQIADRYGLARNTVKRYFRLLKVKEAGWNRAIQSVVFDPDTVETVAQSLGWLRSQRDGALDPGDAASADASPS